MYNFSFIYRASKIDKKGFAPIEFGSPAKVLAKESPNRDQRAKRIQFLLK